MLHYDPSDYQTCYKVIVTSVNGADETKMLHVSKHKIVTILFIMMYPSIG